MSASHRVSVDAVPPQAWQNGGGTTRVLLTRPDHAAWQVRISVADIAADGPFSVFPGAERWFAVLSGSGVALTVDGVPQTLRPSDTALRFSGSAVTTCRLLDGATQDLNLMLRDAQGAMHRAHHAALWRPGASACGLFATVAGVCRHGKHVTPLEAGSLLWLDEAPPWLRFDALEPDVVSSDAPGASGKAGTPDTPGRSIGWWLAATPMSGSAR